MIDLQLRGFRGKPEAVMDVGAGLRQRREIGDKILPDPGVGAGESQDDRAGPFADQSAGFKAVSQPDIVQDERRDPR